VRGGFIGIRKGLGRLEGGWSGSGPAVGCGLRRQCRPQVVEAERLADGGGEGGGLDEEDDGEARSRKKTMGRHASVS
jgi:hypothetical protein